MEALAAGRIGGRARGPAQPGRASSGQHVRAERPV